MKVGNYQVTALLDDQKMCNAFMVRPKRVVEAGDAIIDQIANTGHVLWYLPSKIDEE